MWNYLEDASSYKGFADKIQIPKSEAELVGMLVEAQANAIPVTIAGAGSGLTGGRVPEGGWSISIEKFNGIAIHDGYAVCGAGAVLRDLHAAARRAGQFYPPDPTETLAAIGGTISCNSSGSRSFLYGSTRRWIRRLRVALMDGRILDVRRGEAINFEVSPVHQPASTKHSAGYPLAPGMDWIDLFTGAEGTLGVIVEAELKLLPLPKELLNGVVFFSRDEAAIDAVEAWRGVAGLRMLEYADVGSLKLIREKYSDIPAEAVACVIVEQILGDGNGRDDTAQDDTALDEWELRLTQQSAMAEQSWFGSTDGDRERFRVFRHSLPEQVLALGRQMGFAKMGSDFAVPVNKNREMLAFYRKRISECFDAPHVMYGHIGDAHLHVNLFPGSAEQVTVGQELMREFAKKSVDLGGTVAAEHGLGKRKRDFLPLMFAPSEIEAMRAVKLRLDPKWLLGRGNLFPISPAHRGA